MRANFVASACIPSVLAALAPAGAYEPTGDIAELYDFSRLARLRPGVRCKMFSSYDRKGGNDDGFNGTWSKLRVENGNSVIAEMAGPGVIHRIWFTHSEYKKDGLLALKGEHLRLFLDGKAEPALDVPLEAVFSGKLERFPAPLVGAVSGGFWCYVPIPYRSGCRVEVEGTAVRFYHLTYSELPSAEGVTTFAAAPTGEEKEKLAKAAKAWGEPGSLDAAEPLPIKEAVEKKIVLAAAGERIVPLVRGPAIVRAVEVEADEKDWPAWIGARLRIAWDGAARPGVDVPVEYLFGQAMRPAPFRSLLAGVTGRGLLRFYCFYPMPYRKDARLVLAAPAGAALAGTVRAVVAPLVKWEDDLGYFHAAVNAALPTTPKVPYPWLVRSGRGHYAGTYLVTEGKGDLPLWLEGDEMFTVDGELRIHGTGTEDYFNCGWYAVPGRLAGPVACPLHGFTVYEDHRETARAAAYRWHLTDVVPFEKEIRAEIEHGGEDEKVADYRSAAFWYDDRPEAGE